MTDPPPGTPAGSVGRSAAPCSRPCTSSSARATGPRSPCPTSPRPLREGINGFLLSSQRDPLIRALLTGDIKPELLRLITTEAGPLIERATEVLTPALAESWMRIEESQARLAASIIARIGISFISLPPEDPDQLASGLTEVIAPYLQKVVQVDLPG